MKSLTTTALILIGAIASAQTDAWYAARFGFNAPAPDLFGHQSANSYKNFVYNEGKPAARFNNSAGMMTGAGIAKATTGRSWSDPAYHGWADTFEMTDLLPKNTWVRVPANIQNHFPNPVNSNGQVNRDRNTGAIVGRIMFRGTNLSNGLNILWNITPGIYPTETSADGWSNITTNPSGAALPNAIVTGDPALRDWWRPRDEFLPYLKAHIQTFVWDVNDAAANITRQRTTGTMTENFISRMAFQLGNEPAAGHPGGSVNGQVGSWDGVGKVLEGTMSTTDYRPRAANIIANQVPTNFGTNTLTMPAFSMFSESSDAYRLNYTKGQIRTIQWAGSVSPGINEVASYQKEMTGKVWAANCGRRALHFNSPTYRWKFNANSQYNSTNTNDLLTSTLIDPALGRWETPAEYAKRWVVELEKQVDLVSSLPMPGSSKIVDITECYFTTAQSGGVGFNPGTKFADGKVPNYAAMTLDQVRAMSRSHKLVDGAMVPIGQPMPTRESLLVAIRTELYARDMAGTLTPNLGKIFWWGAGWPDPRTETGLCIDEGDNAIGYNPWGDLRLTLSEVKAIWNK
jgi:hypothetical protein